jgi:hypothetical protein
MGWRGKLQDQYSSWDEFKNCSDIYGLVKRLGYKTAKAAWEDNPMVEGSVDPSDYRKVRWDSVAAISEELVRLGFIEDGCKNYLFSKDLLARITEYGLDQTIQVYFAEKKTFDGWANSKNFVVNVGSSSLGYLDVDIEKAVKHARKICRSKVFNFNRYFHTIDLT